MNEASGSSGKLLIGVKVDRFWNRYWRLVVFVGVVVLSCITGVMWMSNDRSKMEGILDTEWKAHYTYEKQPASRVMFQAPNKTKSSDPGINVYEQEQMFEDYVEDEQDNPVPDEVEYYYDDKHDQSLKSRVDENYSENYEEETRKAKENKSIEAPPLSAIMPELRDYTLKDDFRDPFRSLPDKYMEFEQNYDNPCWPESVPRYPYQNNSYLLIDQQQKLIDPVFQGMRRRFAARTKPETRWRLRCLPSFYVMEAPPLATPNLFTVLGYHPKIALPQVPEPEYWNKHGPSHMAPLRDYVDLFDHTAQQIRDNSTRLKLDGGGYEWRHTIITGDGTSSYLWAFDSWKKVRDNDDGQAPKQTPADFIYKLTPLAKLVFVLRNPTERLFQGYLSRTEAPSRSDFHDKVGQSLEKMTTCSKARSMRSCVYDGNFNRALPVRLRIGMYYPFMADWLRVFPREQVMVLRYEDYVAKPSETINNVCNFLDISPFPIKDLELVERRVQATERRRRASQIKMLSTTKAMLKAFHSNLNEKLAELLEDDQFTWPELATPDIEDAADYEQPETEEEMERKQRQQEAIQEQREEQRKAQEHRKADYMAKLKEWRLRQMARRRAQGHQGRSDLTFNKRPQPPAESLDKRPALEQGEKMSQTDDAEQQAAEQQKQEESAALERGEKSDTQQQNQGVDQGEKRAAEGEKVTETDGGQQAPASEQQKPQRQEPPASEQTEKTSQSDTQQQQQQNQGVDQGDKRAAEDEKRSQAGEQRKPQQQEPAASEQTEKTSQTDTQQQQQQQQNQGVDQGDKRAAEGEKVSQADGGQQAPAPEQQKPQRQEPLASEQTEKTSQTDTQQQQQQQQQQQNQGVVEKADKRAEETQQQNQQGQASAEQREKTSQSDTQQQPAQNDKPPQNN